MESVLCTIGDGVINALVSSGTNLFPKKLKVLVEKEGKRGNLKLGKLQRDRVQWIEDRVKRTDLSN